MMTVRHIERLWTSKSYAKLLDEMLVARGEAAFRTRVAGNPTVVAAAAAMIRLDELNQSHTPLFSALLRSVLSFQEADGGWGEPMTTALCVRALSISQGAGIALDRGLDYLATLQQPQGLWPNVPIRRMPADPCASAFVLLLLGDHAEFRRRVRVQDAVAWFLANAATLDDDSRAVWERARLRCRIGNAKSIPAHHPSFEWSARAAVACPDAA